MTNQNCEYEYVGTKISEVHERIKFENPRKRILEIQRPGDGLDGGGAVVERGRGHRGLAALQGHDGSHLAGSTHVL